MIVFAAASGCSLFSYDHTERIVERTLLDGQGSLDKAAYSAALSAKFPIGSPAAALRTYVEATGGTCREKELQALWCEIPVHGELCYAYVIGIEARTENGAIAALTSRLDSLSC